MPRSLFADPKTDITFKRIFGSEDHKDILIAFLNSMLDLDEAHRIVRVQLLSPEQRPPVAELKLSIVDVKCIDAHGVTYIVEMQVLQVEGFEKRIVYNVAKAYVNQSARGDSYPGLNDVVGITICDFVIWPDSEGPKVPMLSRWCMTEQHTGAKGPGQLQLIFLELPKYDTSRPPVTMVEKWVYFFREADNLAMVPEVLTAHPFIDALDAARIATFTLGEWDAYILSGMMIQDERGRLSFAEKRGRQEGLKEGREEGREEGLRQAVEVLCRAKGIDLTDERKRELSQLNATELTALLAQLDERRSWT